MTQQKPDDNAAVAKSDSKNEASPKRGEAYLAAGRQSQRYEDEIDLVDYIKVVFKYRWMIVAIVLISMIFAGVSSLSKPKMYKAQATFFPLSTQSNIRTEGIVIKPNLDIEDLVISILNSRKMADRVINQLKLQDLWNLKLMVSARKILNNVTKINLERNGIIKLSVKSTSPELSAKIANAYVDNLDYFNRQLNIGAQRNIVQVIDRAIIPEERMSRSTVKNTLVTAIASFMFAVFLAFFIEFIRNSDLKNRLKEN